MLALCWQSGPNALYGAELMAKPGAVTSDSLYKS